jgi:hypothetical protein
MEEEGEPDNDESEEMEINVPCLRRRSLRRRRLNPELIRTRERK